MRTREEETWIYGKYHLILPEEIDENGVYILRGAEEYRQKLLEAGFQIEWYEDFAICYK